ncbi:nucleosome assembly protein like protein, partial [Tanacetum coccineum]
RSQIRSKNAKPITKIEDCESFFNFFNPPQVHEDKDDIDEEEMLMEGTEELQNQMEQDYDFGMSLKVLEEEDDDDDDDEELDDD